MQQASVRLWSSGCSPSQRSTTWEPAASLTCSQISFAAAILSENDTFGKKRKERLDSVSAAVLLESYLAYRKHHPEEQP